MSPKANKSKSAPAKVLAKAVPAKAAKAPAKAEKAPKVEAKAAGKKAKAAAADDEAPLPPAVDPDEAEEAEDAAEAAASGGGGGGGNAAALAAASGSGEMSASFKNFRHHPDMENFYRFIFENDLRHEALAILDTMMIEKQAKKAAKAGGKHA